MLVDRHIFVGPTLTPNFDKALLSSWTIHPPAKRGDIESLVKQYTVSKDLELEIAIVDGLFYSVPAVGHQEIIDALREGIKVYGLSSMGAIRAAELQSYGMIGYGQVYAQFMKNKDLPDDAVTQLHGNSPDYAAYSEPYIHLEAALRELYSDCSIDAKQYRSIREYLLSQWYGHRSWDLLSSLLAPLIGVKEAELLLSNTERFQIKTIDLMNFLEEYWIL